MTNDEVMKWIYANPETKVLEVDEASYYRLLAQVPHPIRPEPPIKTSIREYGFFTDYSHTEWDYHAPEYLAALERYNELCSRMSRMNELVWQGPFGIVQIKIKDSK